MTDFSLPKPNNGPAVVDSLTANGFSLTKLAPSSTLVASGPQEDEDYTIKCICGFHDDDGNTVLCEHCETWQHTECYYFKDGEVLDVSEIEHYCADCKPRRLDERGAVERQTTRREQSDLGERKVKKAAAKSHKKKVRASEVQITLANGTSPYESYDSHAALDRSAESPRESFPSAKRPKTSHRHSGSLQSSNVSHGGNDKRSSSATCIIHSPSRTPNKYPATGYLSEPYSHEFMHLYDDDPGDATMQANLFNDITITSSLSSWTQDAEALAEASNGLSPQEIFHRCEQPLDTMDLPALHKDCKEGARSEMDDRSPRWKFLITDSPLPKGSIVGELKGKIGHMHDYVQDPANRWDYLRHPVPFVFFHPRLPIYIDTRREGTRCRYLRRSCRPNLHMTTILENGSDYRFCFVAKDDLEAGTELTIGWTLDQHIRNFFHRRSTEQASNQGTNDADEDYVSDWVGKVLADFGGCACDSPTECSLAKYDRRSSQSVDGAFKLPNGNAPKGRNSYSKRYSPMSDPMMQSRSHDVKQQEDDDDDRSTSGSLRSKQRSREITPTRRDTTDHGFAMGLELSDREKRKIAALEKNFEQIEHDKNQPAHKKKKRNSGSSSAQIPAHLPSRQQGPVLQFTQANTPGIAVRPQYLDANLSRGTSGSPVGRLSYPSGVLNGRVIGRKKRPAQTRATPTSPIHPRPIYVSTSMQTDPDGTGDWYTASVSDRPRKPFVSLSKQLLLRSQRERIKLEQRLEAFVPSHKQDVKIAQGPNGNRIMPAQGKADIEMQDVQICHQEGVTMNDNPPIQKPRPPDIVHPGSEALNMSIKPPPPPPPPPFNSDHSATNLRVQLPTSAVQPVNITSLEPRYDPNGHSTAARPRFGHAQDTYLPLSAASNLPLTQPSPVKKKLSMGEYFKLKNNKTDSSSLAEKPSNSSPVTSDNPIKPLVRYDEAKSIKEEDGAIVDTPKQEEGTSTEASIPAPERIN